MDIISTIKEKYSGLTRKQKQIADYMLEHIERMSFLTLRELSKETGITPMTILNTCMALGYSSFNEMKYESRKYLSLQEKVEVQRFNEYSSTYIPSYELDDQKKLLREICDEESGQMTSMMSGLDEGKILEIAEVILIYKQVVICGRGISKLMGDFLAIRFAGSGIAPVVMDTELNDSVNGLLTMIRENTLLIAISFPDYYLMTDKVVEYAKGEKCKIIGITSSENAAIVPYCDHLLIAPSNTRLFLNTPSSAIALLNVLTSAVEIMARYHRRNESPTEKFGKLFENV